MKRKLADREWRFDRITEADLHAAWMWEIGRETGSNQKPWLALSNEQREHIRCLVGAQNPPVKEKQLNQMTEAGAAWRDNLPLELHGFEIDWSRSKDDIRDWFANWARSKPHPKAKREWPKYTNKGGAKNQFKPWLVDLAIYRASAAGIPVSKAKAQLQPLYAWCPDGWGGAKYKFSAIGWSKAKAHTAERIAEQPETNAAVWRMLANMEQPLENGVPAAIWWHKPY